MNQRGFNPAPNAPAPPASAKPEATLKPSVCSVLDVLCGRWTSAILQTLECGAMRSNELSRALPGSSRKTLTQSLRRLESLGLLERHIFADVPVRVEYRLTPLGQAFVEPVHALSQWAQAHQVELQAVFRNSAPPSK